MNILTWKEIFKIVKKILVNAAQSSQEKIQVYWPPKDTTFENSFEKQWTIWLRLLQV